MILIKEVFGAIDVVDDVVAVEGVAVESLVNRLLAASGMTIGAPLRTRRQKAAKLPFYILPRKKVRFINWWLTQIHTSKHIPVHRQTANKPLA